MPQMSQHISNAFEIPEPFYFFNIFITEPGFILSEHSHDRFHVNLITSGTATVETAKGTFDVTAGNVFIMPPNTPHSIRTEIGYSQIGMDINVTGDKYGICESLKRICAGKIRILPANKHLSLKNEITRSVLCDISPINALECINKMTALLIDIIKNCNQSKDSNFKNAFLSAIRESVISGADISALCRKTGYSKTQLERLVKQNFGCGAVEYANRLRYNMICSELSIGTLSAAQIADKYGFCDSSHLNVFFRKRSGVSPSEYRRAEKSFGTGR